MTDPPLRDPLVGLVRFAAVALGLLSWGIQDAHGESVVMGVIGDFGVAAEGPVPAAAELGVANLVKRWHPHFIFTTGDNNYRLGAAATIDPNIGQFYHEYIHPYLGAFGSGASSNRFFPCLGNHDLMTANGAPYYQYFSLPGNERYYQYRYGLVEIFAINSNPDPDGTSSTSVQARWLQTQLGASTARWKLVYFHHPPYSASVSGAGNPGMRWPFAAWGASAVFAGHEHSYARIFTNNLYYFVNGLGGDGRESGGLAGGPVQVRYNADFGAMRLEATETNLVIHFVNRSEVIIDTLTLGAPVWSPFILAPPEARTVTLGSTATFNVQATGATPLGYQWLSNNVPLPNATSRTLLLPNVQFGSEADYAVRITSGTTSTISRPARLTVLRHPLITQHPTNQISRAGLAVTFTVSATGAVPLRYQWLFSHEEIPDATNAWLVLTNIQLGAMGDYRVRVTDRVGSVVSQPGHLTVLLRPVITMQPVHQSAPEGGSATLSVAAIGTLPMNYSWRRNGRIVTNLMLNQGTCYWTIRDLQQTNAGSYTVGITNLAGPASSLTSNGVLTVLADLDRDGMPDDWELSHGFNADDPGDATLDADGDGLSNREEYQACSDPFSGSSLLRFERIQVQPDGQSRLEFVAVSNKTYAIETQEAAGPGSWQPWVEVIAVASNRMVEVIDPGPPDPARQRFYRLVTPAK